MINLSKVARNSNLSLREKRVAFFDPEIYIAENIGDYKINLKNLKNPFWKNNPFMESNYYPVISIYNVGLERVFVEEKEVEGFVKLHDETGEMIVYWAEKNEDFPAIHTYKECAENQNLKEKDWIYKVQLRCFFPNLPTINFIQKSENKIIKENESSKKELESFFPELIPAFSF